MRQDIQIIKKSDAGYPEKLRQMERMPERLYVIGALPDPARKSVAIVGARGCSPYGKKEAVRFAKVLAGHGVQIISGMAKGIDSWAHIGALEAGGKTFAVVGCGVDICYPPSHAVLYEQLQKYGGILSEFEPGMPARPHHFPLRNRIISALADIVLVVEARKKSGSLITASYALEQGKSIYAIPGKNSDALSEGCNLLLADGAGVAFCPEVLLEELGLSAGKTEAAPLPLPAALQTDAAAQVLWQALTTEEKSLEQLLQETGLPGTRLMQCLIDLELCGLVEELPGRFFVRK